MSAFTPEQVDAVLIAAMDEELAAVVRVLGGELREAPIQHGAAEIRVETVAGRRIVLVRSGIGLANAAAAAAVACTLYQPSAIFSVGSAGGIEGKVEVGDVVVGAQSVYLSADARAFGYQLGQVPGMPAIYEGSAELLASCPPEVRPGLIVSGDVFVDATQLPTVLERFPDASAVDMETVAIAQTAFTYQVPFLSVRGISDLCGVAAAAEHAHRVDDVSARSAATVAALLA